MKDIENSKKEAPLKEAPFLGLTGMGGGVASLMWRGATGDGPFSLWVMGQGEYGLLAQNNNTNYSSPRQVPGEWQKLGGGENQVQHMGGIKPDGTLWTWGRNNGGQLGHNSKTQRSSPMQIGTDTTWANVSMTYSGATLATKTDGTLWAWGYNQKGNLGHNNQGNEYSSPKQIGTGTDWGLESYHMTGGYEGCAAIKTDGTLWKWGNNSQGELGLNDRTQRSSPTQIPGTWAGVADGQGSSFRAVKADGTCWTAGAGSLGVSGMPDTTRYSSPTQLGWQYTAFIPTSNLSASPGIQVYGQSPAANWGGVYVTGMNDQGGLGQNNTSNAYGIGPGAKTVSSPSGWKEYSMDSGERFMGGVRVDGTMWIWGNNSTGELGQNNTIKRSSPVQLGTNADWWQFKCLANGSYMLRDNL